MLQNKQSVSTEVSYSVQPDCDDQLSTDILQAADTYLSQV